MATHRAQGLRLCWRLRWPDAIRDEVLARLLAFNAERAAEEARAGHVAAAKAKRKSKRRDTGPDLFDP